MAPTYQFALSGNKSKWSFCDYVKSKHAPLSQLVSECEALLEPLNQLPNDWWPQAARLTADALNVGGAVALQWRLHQTLSCLYLMDRFGLHFRSRTVSVNRAWEDELDDYERRAWFDGKQSCFNKYLIQQRELVARELLIHSLPKNERVSLFTRGLMRDHRDNMNKMMSKTRIGSIASKATVKKIADSDRRQRGAEYLHISDELPRYYVEDCGYIGLWCTYTLPREYHPGSYAGATDGLWLAAGRATPKEGHAELVKRHRRLHDACRDSGIIPHGRWDLQAHEDGTAHLHEMVFLINQGQVEEFKRHARRIFPDSQDAGAFNKRQQAVVIVQLETAEEAVAKLAYAGRHRWHDMRLPNNGMMPERHPDELWAELWEFRQHQHFGQQPLAHWRMMEELDPKLMSNPEYRATLPAAVLAAYDAASGPTRSYRDFLHLTEPTAPRNALTLMFSREDKLAGTCIALIDPSSATRVSISLSRERWNRLEGEEELPSPQVFVPFLQLSIAYPIHLEPEPPSPLPPPWKRSRFDFARR